MGMKQVPKKKTPAKKKAPAKKRAKGKRPTDLRIQPKPVIDMDRLSDDRPFMLENKYRWTGRPAIYETWEALETECNRYFEWIEGIYFEKDTPVKMWSDEEEDYVTEMQVERVWVRVPQPPTITGLVLFLGFAHRQSMHDQMERGAEFSDVITRAVHRVEMSYEMDLRDRDKTRGAQFALPNIGRRSGWSNTQAVQNLDSKGQPTDPPKSTVINVGSIAPNIDKNI